VKDKGSKIKISLNNNNKQQNVTNLSRPLCKLFIHSQANIQIISVCCSFVSQNIRINFLLLQFCQTSVCW